MPLSLLVILYSLTLMFLLSICDFLKLYYLYIYLLSVFPFETILSGLFTSNTHAVSETQ